jgi:hypothetical protein
MGTIEPFMFWDSPTHPMRAYYYAMRNTATIVILSVVATVLVFGLAACITIKPFAAIGLAPILAAISLIIRAIRGQPTNPYGRFKKPPPAPANIPAQPSKVPTHPTHHSSHPHIPSAPEQPNEITPQSLNHQQPTEATPDSILAPPDITDAAQPIPIPPTPATNPRRRYRPRWPQRVSDEPSNWK